MVACLSNEMIKLKRPLKQENLIMFKSIDYKRQDTQHNSIEALHIQVLFFLFFAPWLNSCTMPRQHYVDVIVIVIL